MEAVSVVDLEGEESDCGNLEVRCWCVAHDVYWWRAEGEEGRECFLQWLQLWPENGRVQEQPSRVQK
jgi:hypothetical protein